ncbi:unnamed protein product [Hymenolepis diminuta]|uniref:Uncharacterized protein n=1 Tax=Hymenolepis diminuta TaxID=6216 RepID=A0A564Z5I8_HYMDI|nr:unnamed protein product [Hymenolepis diminuta]
MLQTYISVNRSADFGEIFPTIFEKSTRQNQDVCRIFIPLNFLITSTNPVGVYEVRSTSLHPLKPPPVLLVLLTVTTTILTNMQIILTRKFHQRILRTYHPGSLTNLVYRQILPVVSLTSLHLAPTAQIQVH